MGQDRRYDWSAAAAAQILNLGYLLEGQPKTIQFQKIADVIYQCIRLAEEEWRELTLRPSSN